MKQAKTPMPKSVGLALGAIASLYMPLAFGQAPAPAAAASAPARAGDADLQQIVVTATRRSEKLSEVPISVSAVTGLDVEAKRITNFSDVVNITPGPTFIPVKGSATSTIQIRGRYSNNDATSLQNPVGVYIDDLYYGSLASFDSDFFDIQQIAVLRGPQGTTFGRNAVGGAVQVTSNVAVIGESSGQASVTAMKFDHGQSGLESTGYFNVPLGAKLAGRLAYSVKNDGGYQHNLVTGHYVADDKIAGFKGSLAYRPEPDLKLTALGSYSRRNNKGDGARVIGMGWVAAAEAAASNSLHDVMIDDEGKITRDIGSLVLKAEKNLDAGTLSLIGGYRHLNASFASDSDGGPMPANFPSINLNREDQESLELRFVSKTDHQFDYVTGLYLGYENLFHSILFNFNGTSPNTELSVFTKGTLQTQLVTGTAKTLSVGPYFEGRWKFNPQWSLTGGLRYVYDRKKGLTEHDGTSAFYGGPYVANLPSTNWTAVTPRTILEYKPAKDVMFYGSVSAGYQGGGWVLTAPTQAKALVPLQPEKTLSYELGTKSSFLGGRLVANASLYQANTRNLQVRSLVNGTLNDTNAGEARVRGLELELAVRPVRNLTLGVNYAYTDAIYKSFPGCAAPNIDCSGNPLPFTPKNDTTLYADWSMSLGSAGSLIWHADDKFADSYRLAATNTQQIAWPYTRRDGILNGSVTYVPESGKWDLRFWSKNLTNRQYAANSLNYYFYNMSVADVKAASAAGLTPDSETMTIAPPRSIGATYTYYF
ncbi:MAG: TonB-dependent receptor [Burkholderiales bacterium]|nr:TonB-dependent receptor [Burkholderiales bacterium]MDE1927935.1 TonB-dependent receptor [Burkholderiales bacterium]MDE2159337.1 TonB-dependent receptor [Burkholderiales bacterium]MDE2505048.1 TonB-dependent receptor [Burkholderiales bacterium]